MTDTEEPPMSGLAILAGLAATGVMLYDRVPVAWQWYLRNFWWDQELWADTSCGMLCLTNGRVLIFFWAFVTAVAWLVAAALLVAIVAGSVDWFLSKLRRERDR